MTELMKARAAFDAAKALLHAAAIEELATNRLGVFWVGEETEIFVAASPEAIRAAGLAQPDDEIQPIDPKQNEKLMEEILGFAETASLAMLEQPCQLWTAYQ